MENMDHISSTGSSLSPEEEEEEEEGGEGEEEEPTNGDAMKKVLKITELLLKIIKSLENPAVQLKICRLVSKSWNQISDAAAAPSSRFWKVTLDWSKYSKNFDDLLLLLPPNSKLISTLPSSTFELRGGPLLSSPWAKTFFDLYGSSIKTLILNKVQLQCWTSLEKILTQTPNLHTLSLANLDISEIFVESDENLSLPTLHTFEWEPKVGPFVVQKILRASPNLRTIPFLTTKHLDVVTGSGQRQLSSTVGWMQCLKFLRSWPPASLSAFALAVSKKEGKIQKLEIGVSRGGTADFESFEEKFEYTSAFQKLLQVAALHLEHLSLNSFGTFFSPGFKFPPFPKLRVLSVTVSMFSCVEFPQVFPPGIDLAVTFPNLRTFDCTQLSMNYDFNWAKYFPPSNPFQGCLDSVKNLMVNDKCNHFWMDKLTILCPNFDQLTLHIFSDGLTVDLTLDLGDDENISTVFPKVFKKWGHLRVLNLHFRNENIDPYQLDPIFTAMDKHFCDQVRHQLAGERGNGGPGGGQKFKIFSSAGITQLRQLETLRIRFHRQSNFPLSNVSHQYAFQFMPHLQKIRIEFDHQAPRHGNRGEFDDILKTLTDQCQVNVVHRK